MSRVRGFIMVMLAYLLCTLGAFAAQSRTLHTWFVDSLIKIFPADAPGTHRLGAPEYWGARNQHVSVQLAIRAARPLAGVSAEVSPLENPAGGRISSVDVHRVGYVVVGSNTPDAPPDELVGEAPGWYPDPLLDLPFDLAAGKTHSLWVTIHIPSDAAPGIYRGAIAVRVGNREVARASFRLKVIAATVPEERSLKVTNWFNYGDKVAQQFYGFSGVSPFAAFSQEGWKLLANLGQVMSAYRQNVIITPLMDLVQPRLEAGELRYDFGQFDRWVETFQKAGVIGYIEGSHLLGRGGDSYGGPLQIATFQDAGGQVRREVLPPDDPRVEPFLAGFLTALHAHLEAKGWKSIYFQHILDEAHGSEPPYYAKIAAIVRRYLPGVPTMDAVDAERMPEELQQNCDIWVPQLGKFDDQMELLARRIQSGREIWFYTCLYPQGRYLNRLLDFPLLKVRLLHWFNFRHNLTGYLHWGWNYWTPEPIKDTQPVINANTQLLPPGDAFIVYPDRANLSVFSSIRLEAMRDGLEDYELLRTLNQKNPAEAERLARAAVTSFTEYVRDPGEFRKLERSLLEALSKN